MSQSLGQVLSQSLGQDFSQGGDGRGPQGELSHALPKPA